MNRYQKTLLVALVAGSMGIASAPVFAQASPQPVVSAGVQVNVPVPQISARVSVPVPNINVRVDVPRVEASVSVPAPRASVSVTNRVSGTDTTAAAPITRDRTIDRSTTSNTTNVAAPNSDYASASPTVTNAVPATEPVANDSSLYWILAGIALALVALVIAAMTRRGANSSTQTKSTRTTVRS